MREQNFDIHLKLSKLCYPNPVWYSPNVVFEALLYLWVWGFAWSKKNIYFQFVLRSIVNTSRRETPFRRSCLEVSYRKGVLKNLVKFLGKYLCHFFNKVLILWKNRYRHRCFLVNFAKVRGHPWLTGFTFSQNSPYVCL